MDAAILATAAITGIISLSSGLIRTKRADYNFFVLPALRGINSVKESINENAVEKCPDCNEFVEPFFGITMRRIQLVASLTPILFGLLTQSVLLFVVYNNATAGLSLIFWASFPAILIGRYLFELRDVFDWWKNPYVRNALAITSISVGVIVATNPYLLDIVGWIANPQLISIGSFMFNSEIPFCLSLFVFGIFLFGRYMLNQIKPSFKTRITRHLIQNPSGHTLEAWIRYLDPDQELPRRVAKEKAEHTLRELVYQGIMKIKMQNRSSEPIYALAT